MKSLFAASRDLLRRFTLTAMHKLCRHSKVENRFCENRQRASQVRGELLFL